MINSRIDYLIERYLQNGCTQEEKIELARWIQQANHDTELMQMLEEKWTNFRHDQKIAPDKSREIISSILKSEHTELAEMEPVVRRLNWRRISVAASIVLLIGAGSFFWFYSKPGKVNGKEVAARNKSAGISNDVSPGKTKATLILSDGSQIVLDNNPDGTLAVQGNTKILNQQGELIYNNASNKNGEILYNTLTTNRGEQFPLKLSDGTKLWLNAASSIRFPVSFSGKERRVEITGEAYFEVARNADKPFKVVLNEMEITVLGTHFNVNGYADGANVRTTLLEGSVRVANGNETLNLMPGQQAKLNRNGRMGLIENADIEQAISWKNGYFHFTADDLETVMRDLSRWYDVDVYYEDASRRSKQYFSGDIEKSLTLSAVLRVLEKSQVHLRIEGKKLIVMP